MIHPLKILLDDRTRVKLLGHIMGRRPDQFDTPLVGLGIGIGAHECRKKTVRIEGVKFFFANATTLWYTSFAIDEPRGGIRLSPLRKSHLNAGTSGAAQ